MSLISYTPLQDGVTGVNAAATNTPLSTIYNDYNGNVTDANISASAAIAGSKVSLASVKNPYKFQTYLTSAQTVSGNTWTKVSIDTKVFDTGTNFDVATNHQFTAPIAGFYLFTGSISMSGMAATGRTWIGINVNTFSTNPTYFQETYAGANATCIVTFTKLISLSANDTVQLYGQTGSTTFANGVANTYFEGLFVSAT